ncbi:No apical meristem (NAM) protein [Cucumis melo var. makuwa]|uniref:No apical meristem (NAM) protein n=1 Tax=Cucumis melo var. makuwa TaxID=1194695 RepID=A0A5D3E5P0_CUCMM|nr:No apical meristem (NAM) protein [Cucumis melo var. makuwa]TYK30930.1 No apical meristem (NAM) protein [Cucumis melo var. makuwa]
MEVDPIHLLLRTLKLMPNSINPYFIHHSLGPTAAIVMQPLTGAINYISWSRAMLMAISGRNKAGFITGKIQKPSDGVLLDAWICNNDILASWILNSVSKEIAASIIYTGSSTNSPYATFTFNQHCISLLIQEEQQRSAGILTPPIDPVALFTTQNIAPTMAISTDRNRKKERPTCCYCGIKGHIADKCYKKHGYPPGYKPRNSNPITNTSKTNKVANTNSTAANHSPDFFSSLNSEQYSQLMTLLNNHLQAAITAPITLTTTITHTPSIFSLTSHNNQSHDEWIIVSGASRHVCHDKSLFRNWSHTNNMFVMLPNGHRISVDLIGDILINGSLLLKDVLFVPQFAYDLISDLSRPMMIGNASCHNGRQKSDVLHIVPKFFQLIETQFSKVIKSFRSDNAHELKFTEFFAQKGSVHQFSCVERPQQNSVVERKHQHLLNVARALFISQEFLSVFGQIAS